MRDGMTMLATDSPSMINGPQETNEMSLDRLSREYAGIKTLDEDEFGTAVYYDEYEETSSFSSPKDASNLVSFQSG